MLLVEDDPTTRRALEMLLARHGWRVESVSTLAAAMRKLASSPPEALVLDLMLPDGNGVAVLEHIRAQKIATRVVITTGASDAAYLDPARALEPAALLHKPIRLNELVKALSPDT